MSSNLEKMMKESASVVLACEELSSEIPKIRQLFQECSRLKEDLSSFAEEKEMEMQRRFDMNIQRAESAILKLDRSMDRCENICAAFGQMEELVQIFGSYQEKLSDLEQRMDTMIQCTGPEPEEGTLLEVIRASQYRLPLFVVHANWYDFRFEILRVADGKAEGNLWKGHGKVERNKKYPLDAKGYSRCTESREALQNMKTDSFINIPDEFDENLPFF